MYVFAFLHVHERTYNRSENGQPHVDRGRGVSVTLNCVELLVNACMYMYAMSVMSYEMFCNVIGWNVSVCMRFVSCLYARLNRPDRPKKKTKHAIALYCG